MNLLLGLTLLPPSRLTAQHDPSESETYRRIFGKPIFSYDAFVFFNPEANTPEIRLFVEFANDLLQFVKRADGRFQAEYELAVELVDANGAHRGGRIAHGELEAAEFAETNSRSRFRRHALAFPVPPGRYHLRFQLTDLNTRRRLRKQRQVDVPDFTAGQVALSPVVFVDSVTTAVDGRQAPVPNLSRSYEDPASRFAAYFEVYLSQPDSVELRWRVLDSDGRTVLEERSRVYVAQTRLPRILPLKKRLRAGGLFHLLVEAAAAGERVTRSADFAVRYVEHDVAGQPDARARLEALEYVCASEEYKRILAAEGAARAALIEQFWRERDPTPETPENELRQEFHWRVRFAARYFSVPTRGKPGWRTDRGKIFIIYGPPSDVRRRSMELDANPYEFWHYDHLGKRFVFLDKSGSGAYRLVHED